MIWNYIRDFLVENVFGGVTSDGRSFSAYVGMLGSTDTDGVVDELYMGNTNTLWYQIDDTLDGYHNYISMGDWLSTTTTIIIMALSVVLMCLLVRWVWRLVSSAMLLK